MKRKKNNKQTRKKNVKYSMCTLSVFPLSQRSESTYVAPAKYTPRRKTHRNTRGCVFSICPGRPSRRLHAPEVVDSCRRGIGRSKKLHAAAHVGKQQIMKQATSAMPRNGLSQWGEGWRVFRFANAQSHATLPQQNIPRPGRQETVTVQHLFNLIPRALAK